MRKRDKPRKPARKEPVSSKPVILIVCEGKNTEPSYFRGLINDARNPRVQIEPIGGQGVPLTVVREAKKRRDAALKKAKDQDDPNLAYDQVWCVFDRDDFKDVPQAFEMANANDIKVGFSNPNFELWLLLHHRDQPGMKHRDDVLKLLQSHVSTYDSESKSVDFALFKDGYPKAVRRAKVLCRQVDDRLLWDRNPYTDVHKLTEIIREEIELISETTTEAESPISDPATT